MTSLNPEPSEAATEAPIGYSTRIILNGPKNPEEFVKQHDTLAKVLSYLTFNNLLIGEPAPWTPVVEVLHGDGVPLTEEELNFLQSNGINEQGYAKRILDATPNVGKYPELTRPPKAGETEAMWKTAVAIAKSHPTDTHNK